MTATMLAEIRRTYTGVYGRRIARAEHELMIAGTASAQESALRRMREAQDGMARMLEATAA